MARDLSSMHEALAMHLKMKTNSQLKSLGSSKNALDRPPRPGSVEHTTVQCRCRVTSHEANWTMGAQNRHSQALTQLPGWRNEAQS